MRLADANAHRSATYCHSQPIVDRYVHGHGDTILDSIAHAHANPDSDPDAFTNADARGPFGACDLGPGVHNLQQPPASTGGHR